MTRRIRIPVSYAGALSFVAGAIALLKLLPAMNETAAALVLVVAVFLVAWIWERGPGVAAAVAATLALNYFFIPPLYTLTISDPRNVFALFAFLAAAVLIGRLSAIGRERLRELEAERRDLKALTELSQAFLADTNRESLAAVAADRLRRALLAEGVVVCLPTEGGPLSPVARSGSAELRRDLAELAFRQGNSAAFPSVSGGVDVYLPIPLGVQRVGALVVTGLHATERMAEGCAALLGLALERERFLKVVREAEESRAREELKSTLLAALGHDLKTPVAAARGAIENWAAEAGPSERSGLATLSLKRLTRVIDDLLNVVGLESGAAHPRIERVAASAIVEAAVARFGEVLAEHDLFLDVPSADCEIEADPAQVAEAVGLALENAARYSPPATAIRVSVERQDGRIFFRIDDAGPGIMPRDRERVMEKFVRLADDAAKPGSGLGLYIVRSLVELNGGTVEIGRSPAGGARLTLAFGGARA